MTLTRTFDRAGIWFFRNERYFVSASWDRPKMGTFHPFLALEDEQPYMTLPINGGILPIAIAAFENVQIVDDATVAILRLDDGARCAIVCLPRSVLWLSPVPLRALAVENDPMSGGKRTLVSTAGSNTVGAITPREPFEIEGPWLNIDARLGLVSATGGWTYTPAGGVNRRSAATDEVLPRASFGAWQMISGADVPSTARAADIFKAHRADGGIDITCLDGEQVFEIHAKLSAGLAEAADVVTIRRQDKE
jgi:hypothetical protein